MPYPTVYEPIATNKTDVTLQATDHPDHHNQLARILNMVQQQHVPDVARANLLTNGGFEIWQRGNGPFTADTLYFADRWRVYAPAGTTSISRDTANIDTPSTACAAVTLTSPTTNGMFQIATEATNNFAGQTVSLSVRVRCSQANSVRVGIQSNRAASLPTTWSAYHSGGGGYETLSTTLAIAGGTTGVTVWILGSVAGTFYVDNAMLVIGSVPADYAPLHPADDLARCLRYYEVIGDLYPYPIIGGYNVGGQGVFIGLPYAARKPVAPTVTKNGTWTVVNCAQPTATGASSLTGLMAAVTITATGYGYAQSGPGNSITIEANP